MKKPCNSSNGHYLEKSRNYKHHLRKCPAEINMSIHVSTHMSTQMSTYIVYAHCVRTHIYTCPCTWPYLQCYMKNKYSHIYKCCIKKNALFSLPVLFVDDLCCVTLSRSFHRVCRRSHTIAASKPLPTKLVKATAAPLVIKRPMAQTRRMCTAGVC